MLWPRGRWLCVLPNFLPEPKPPARRASEAANLHSTCSHPQLIFSTFVAHQIIWVRSEPEPNFRFSNAELRDSLFRNQKTARFCGPQITDKLADRDDAEVTVLQATSPPVRVARHESKRQTVARESCSNLAAVSRINSQQRHQA